MSIRKVLSAEKPSDLTRKILPSGMIRLERGGISVIIPLKEWNRLGLDSKVNV